MKKQNFSKLIAATVATSAIVVPTAALAADSTTAQNGVYFAAQGKFYTVDQLSTIPFTELATLMADNSKVFIYTAGVGTASLAQITATNGNYITAAAQNGNINNPEKVIPSGVYTDKEGNTITLTGNATTELKVESVSAVNGTITVKFNRAPEVTPDAKDFAISRTINGGTSTAVVPTLTWNAATSTATLAVPSVGASDVAQNVVYSVKYKEIPAQNASFTVAAPAVGVKVEGAGYSVNTAGTRHLVNVYFSAPVDTASATNVANYTVSAPSANAIQPVRVTLNTAAVGPYPAGSIATLEFETTTTIAAATQHSVRVSNVLSGGAAIPTSIVNFTTGTIARDTGAPTFAAGVTMADSVGTAIAAAGTVNKGTDIVLQASVTDVENNVQAAQYRVLNAAGDAVIGWTKMSALDGRFDQKAAEVVTSTVSTANLTAGQTYTVEVRAYDAANNVTAAPSTTTFVVANNVVDTAAPSINAITTVNYSPVAVTGTLAQGAKTVRVVGTALDTHSVTTQSPKLSKVEYRVRQVDPTTGNVTTAQSWTDVTLDPGQSYGVASVSYSFVTNALTEGNLYVIEVRATDASGNVSPTQVAAATATGGLTAGFLSTTLPLATGVTAPTDTFLVVKDTTAPVLATATATVPTAVPTSQDGTTAALATRQLELEITGNITDNLAISKVEYSVERVINGVATQVRPYSSAGARILTGSGTAAGTFDINTELPNVSGEYRIHVIAYDASGNTSPVTTITRFVDVTAPTATITANAATPNVKNDFVITFSESVLPSPFTTANFEVKNAAGAVIGTVSAVPTANGTVPNSFVATVSSNLVQVGNTLSLVGITDASGNRANATYTFQASDVE